MNKFTRIVVFSCCLSILMGCQRYAQTTPHVIHEGDNAANYQRVFKIPVPTDVTVLNSVVVSYSWRLGVVTTDDFEFELLVPAKWVAEQANNLRTGEDDFIRSELTRRKTKPIRPWYAPNSLDSYQLYRDCSSVGYIHMLVDKKLHNGRYHVFYSKH